MEKILCYGLIDSEYKKVITLGNQTRTAVYRIPEGNGDKTVEELSRNARRLKDVKTGKIGGSVLIFCDISSKKLDTVLEKVKELKIAVSYKAVMTDTNREWTLNKLLLRLQSEEAGLR
ncbi:DUF3783 domain-containing protein [Butyrivibrio sp. NC3005]|jgi:hypothetical protein|uniref:DUF3783 domain-containing protein n=1 Tax=Butyrivibrio sp. NC3005 TaxID=1280685 RepID=UPI000409828A|nr:DUF3783 domain-containing protein [Butyrivibrio sp. NC3005]